MPVPYRVYAVFGRKVFAVPLTPEALRRLALSRYHSFTPRRRLFRLMAQAMMTVGADSLLGYETDDPATGEFDLAGWLQRVRADLGRGPLRALVFWPSQVERRRLYVHLVGADMNVVGFAKIASGRTEHAPLDREAEASRWANTRGRKAWRCPALLCDGTLGESRYLVFEPLPALAASPPVVSFPTAVSADISGSVREVPASKLCGLSWWDAFVSRVSAADAPFVSELHDHAKHCGAVSVGRVHGDFNPANMLCEGSVFYLYDWDESRSDGPRMTDEIGFFLSWRLKRTLARPAATVRELRARYVRGADRKARLAVMMALAFRKAVGMRDAELVIANWPAAAADAA